MRNPIHFVLVLGCLVACEGRNADSSLSTTHVVTPKFKATAPVKIRSQRLTTHDARIELVFETAARDVTVQVYGTDGLNVRGNAEPVRFGTFPAGHSEVFEVTFTPGEGRSHLAVLVQGTFAGRSQGRVVSFEVGEPSDAQRAAATQGVTRTPEGLLVRTQPAVRAEPAETDTAKQPALEPAARPRRD